MKCKKQHLQLNICSLSPRSPRLLSTHSPRSLTPCHQRLLLSTRCVHSQTADDVSFGNSGGFESPARQSARGMAKYPSRRDDRLKVSTYNHDHRDDGAELDSEEYEVHRSRYRHHFALALLKASCATSATAMPSMPSTRRRDTRHTVAHRRHAADTSPRGAMCAHRRHHTSHHRTRR